jgi:2-polyprenyl-3-methyl-5-hydroxy-6-metoxy-1,4-benzoquinol methylase
MNLNLKENTMEDYYWDSQIEYLSQTRGLYYNDDYLEFLVNSVWKITTPVHIIDFGCGYGYLGSKLLPLLPKGSKYTGVDAGEKLIKHAQDVYKNTHYETEFILGDIQELDFKQNYDIAICHAFLLHMPNPIEILIKMINSVVNNGRVICFEPHWISNMSGYYLDEYDQTSIIQLGFLQKFFEENTKRDGKDGNIGLKLPSYLSKLGVKNIECRVSDKVNFLDPNMDEEKKEKLFKSLREEGLGEPPGERESTIQRLIDRGASMEEAQKQYASELLFSNLFSKNRSLVYASNMKITFGRVIR